MYYTGYFQSLSTKIQGVSLKDEPKFFLDIINGLTLHCVKHDRVTGSAQ